MKASSKTSMTSKPLRAGALACLISASTMFGAEPPKAAGADQRPVAAAEKPGETKALFDGKTLKGWKITDFAGHGEVAVNTSFKLDPKAAGSPAILLEMGALLTGITW